MKKVHLAANEGPVRKALEMTLPIFGVELVDRDAADVLMTTTREETLDALESSQLPVFQLTTPREAITHRRVTSFSIIDQYPAKLLKALAE